MDLPSIEAKIVAQRNLITSERDTTIELANVLCNQLLQKFDGFLNNCKNSKCNKDFLNMSEEFFKDIKNIQESWGRNNHLFTKILGNIHDIMIGIPGQLEMAASNSSENVNKDNQKHEEAIWEQKMMLAYPKPNDSKLIPSEWHSGVISSIAQAENGLFFIVYDISQLHDMLMDLKMLPENLNKFPEIGEIFSCHLEGNYIRSMRIPSQDSQAENQIRIFALDSGEEFDCNFMEVECFQILPYLKRAPSLALFCQILNVDSGVDSKSFLMKNLNEFVEFQVIRVDSAQSHGFHAFLDIFSVNVRAKYLDSNENGDAINLNCPENLGNQELDDFLGRPGNQQRINAETSSSWHAPPDDCRQDSLNDNSESWKVPENNEIFVDDFYKLKVPHEEDLKDVNFDFKDQSSHKQQKVPEISSPEPFDRNNATAQKRKIEILQNDDSIKQKNYGEEFTWNDLEAPGDFEDFVSGLTINETFLELPVEYEVPSEGRIFARFTAIESVDTFYVHLMKYDQNLARKHANTNMEMTLMDLLIHMNEPEERVSYRKLNGKPSIGKIVIAPFSDQNFYRAKVLRIDDETAEAEVIYIDYGNRALMKLANLKEYDDKFSYLPYQAVKMNFVNIVAKDPSDECQTKNAMDHVVDMCYQRMMRIDIVHNFGPGQVFVRVFDEDGFDVGEILIRKNIVAARKEIQGY